MSDEPTDTPPLDAVALPDPEREASPDTREATLTELFGLPFDPGQPRGLVDRLLQPGRTLVIERPDITGPQTSAPWPALYTVLDINIRLGLIALRHWRSPGNSGPTYEDEVIPLSLIMAIRRPSAEAMRKLFTFRCQDCKGAGKLGAMNEPCQTCDGAGMITARFATRDSHADVIGR